MNVAEYINFESERQSATADEHAGMCFAWGWLNGADLSEITEGDIKRLSFFITGRADYRLVPAVFNQGVPALPAQQIPKAMANLVEAINLDVAEAYRDSTDHYVREFLVIHPFADGNGRVASLLRNWMLNTLNNPEPMPYYFGENA